MWNSDKKCHHAYKSSLVLKKNGFRSKICESIKLFRLCFSKNLYRNNDITTEEEPFCLQLIHQSKMNNDTKSCWQNSLSTDALSM